MGEPTEIPAASRRPVRRLKLVVSDFHLGKGRLRPDGSVNVLEDFVSDERFAEFLAYHRSGEYEDAEVELILNGDFLNLLQIDVDERFPDYLTEEVEAAKVEQVIAGHPVLFDALARFAAAPGKAVAFLMGNHDPGLIFEAVREHLRRRIGGTVRFFDDHYRFDGVHVEHGQQHEPMNAFDRRRYLLTRGFRQPVLNLPFGSYYLIHVLNAEKRERPWIDKVTPFSRLLRWLLFNDTAFFFRWLLRSSLFFFVAVSGRIAHARFALRSAWRFLTGYSAFPTLELEAWRFLRTHPDVHVLVMGHTHIPLYREFSRDRVYVNTGTWNAMTSLDVGHLGERLRMTFCQLEYDEAGRPRPRLREWRGHHRVVEDVL